MQGPGGGIWPTVICCHLLLISSLSIIRITSPDSLVHEESKLKRRPPILSIGLRVHHPILGDFFFFLAVYNNLRLAFFCYQLDLFIPPIYCLHLRSLQSLTHPRAPTGTVYIHHT